MDAQVVDQERKKGFTLTRAELFAHRCRYFTDSGIIGSREFVENGFRAVRHLLKSKDERRFTAVGGIDGVFSLKKLGSLSLPI